MAASSTFIACSRPVSAVADFAGAGCQSCANPEADSDPARAPSAAARANPAANTVKRDGRNVAAAFATANRAPASSLAVARDISMNAATAGGIAASLASSFGASTTGRCLSAACSTGSLDGGALPDSAEPIGSAGEVSGLPSCGSAMSDLRIAVIRR